MPLFLRGRPIQGHIPPCNWQTACWSMSRLNGQDETAKAHKVSNIRAGTAGMLGSAWEHQSRGLGAISSLFPPAAPLFLQVSTRHQHQFPQPVYNPYPTQKTMYVAKHLKLEITLLFPLLIWP